ncbi:hypothetical protein CPB86DRAFT_556571 [Serendipita vermifera]|nr:hypothetical protein CPB86DRAFT_556571 [Serendipita vermifera]
MWAVHRRGFFLASPAPFKATFDTTLGPILAADLAAGLRVAVLKGVLEAVMEVGRSSLLFCPGLQSPCFLFHQRSSSFNNSLIQIYSFATSSVL